MVKTGKTAISKISKISKISVRILVTYFVSGSGSE